MNGELGREENTHLHRFQLRKPVGYFFIHVWILFRKCYRELSVIVIKRIGVLGAWGRWHCRQWPYLSSIHIFVGALPVVYNHVSIITIRSGPLKIWWAYAVPWSSWLLTPLLNKDQLLLQSSQNPIPVSQYHQFNCKQTSELSSFSVGLKENFDSLTHIIISSTRPSYF